MDGGALLKESITWGGWVLRARDERWMGREDRWGRKGQLVNRRGLLREERRTCRGETSSWWVGRWGEKRVEKLPLLAEDWPLLGWWGHGEGNISCAGHYWRSTGQKSRRTHCFSSGNANYVALVIITSKLTTVPPLPSTCFLPHLPRQERAVSWFCCFELSGVLTAMPFPVMNCPLTPWISTSPAFCRPGIWPQPWQQWLIQQGTKSFRHFCFSLSVTQIWGISV